jgi:hypothetical protein
MQRVQSGPTGSLKRGPIKLEPGQDGRDSGNRAPRPRPALADPSPSGEVPDAALG